MADIGGTNARFAVDAADGDIEHVLRYAVADFESFDLALERLLTDVAASDEWRDLPAAACIAVACPPVGEVIRFTNSHWQIDRRRTAERLGLAAIEVINDFAAVGYAVSALRPEDWRQLGGGEALADHPIAIFGPGTGLGVCSVVPAGGRWQVISGEGGHVDFAPVDDVEIEVLRVLRARFGRVSYERLLCGAGIVNIFGALAELDGKPAELDTAAAITGAALAGGHDLAERTLDLFFAVLGSVAGNLALTLGAHGGVYIAGGIVPRLADLAAASRLRERFAAKGRLSGFIETIPLRLILRDNLGLFGAGRRLDRLGEAE